MGISRFPLHRPLLARLLTAAFAGTATIILFAAYATFAINLLCHAAPALAEHGASLITADRWDYRRDLYGTLATFYGTIAVSGIALSLAAPVAILAAVFSARYAPPSTRRSFKLALDLLAGIPAVAYGFLGVHFVRVIVVRLSGDRSVPAYGDSYLTAGFVLAIMLVPIICTLADDAMWSYPLDEELAARSLGFSNAQITWFLILPRSLPALLASMLLALARALSETIAVFLLVGRRDVGLRTLLERFPLLLEPGQTITSKLASGETLIAQGSTAHSSALMFLALALTTTVVIVAIAGRRLLRSFAPDGATAHL